MAPQQPLDYLDQGSGVYLRSQLQEMQKNGIYANMVSTDHTKAWDSDQLALQRKINDLAKQSNSGVDPESLTGADNLEQLTLEQIRDLTDQIQSGVVQKVSEAWAAIGKGLTDASNTLSDGLKNTIGNNDSWQGKAKASAADAIGKFIDTSKNVGTGATMVGMKVSFAQRGSDETYRMLSPILSAVLPASTTSMIPNTTALKPTVPGTLASLVPTMAGVQSAQSQKDEARDAAVQVLKNVYSPAMHGGDQGVPTLQTVQQSAKPTGPIAPTSIAPGSSNQNSKTPNNATPNSGTPSDQQNNNQSDNTQPTSTSPSQNSHNQSTTPADTTGLDNSANSTTPASTTTAGLGSSAGTGGSDSGTGTGGGLSYGGTGGSDSDSSSGGGRGSSIPGKATAAAASAANTAAASRTSTTNSSAMSPGSMGQGSRNSESDKDHKTSELLHGQHLDEWIGTGDQVLPAFGVIGGQVPAAQASDDQPKQPRPGQPGPGRVQGEYR